MKTSLLPFQNFFLCVYFFSLNFESLNIGGVFSISKFTGILYLISILPNFREFFILDKKILFFLRPLFIFLVILFINSIININTYSSKIFDFTTSVNILLFIAIINHARKNYLILDKVIIIYMIGSFLLSTLIYFGFGISTSFDGRTVIFGTNANALGINISTSFLILIATVFFNSLKLKKIKRFFLLLFLPFLIISIIGTASRSAILVILLSLIFLLLIRVVQNKNKISSTLSSILIVAIILIPFAYFVFQSEEFMARILITADADSNLRLGGRLMLWDGFIYIISTAPFFGYGYSGTINESFKYFGFVESPHNVFLEVFLYTGLFGFLFYTIFVVRIFYKSYLLCKHEKIIIPVLLISPILAYLIANQALPIKFVWALLAYLVGKILFYPRKYYNK
tara:strand:+ start:19100 stop:20293 length:1194 start_codon:yes stop_codon:yes gene_type:complete